MTLLRFFRPLRRQYGVSRQKGQRRVTGASDGVAGKEGHWEAPSQAMQMHVVQEASHASVADHADP